MASEEQSKIPDWLPDWKEEPAYPDPKKTISNEQWAWEFIRRNPRYQQLYRSGRRHKALWYEKFPNSKNFYKYFKCTPKVNKEESYQEYRERCIAEGKEPKIKPRRRKILDEFPVIKFSSKLNPKNSEPPEFSTDYNYPFIFIAPDFIEEDDFTYNIKGDDEVFIVFSSALPIDNQIEKAKKFLKEDQDAYKNDGNNLRHEGKVQTNVLRDYLRYLDAELNGVKQVDMAKLIHKNQDEKSAIQKVNKGLNKARYYRDEGFFKILKTELLFDK